MWLIILIGPSPAPSSIEVLSLPRSSFCEMDGTDETASLQPDAADSTLLYFQQVAGAANNAWLLEREECSKSTHYTTMEYFRNVPDATSAWLLNKEVGI